MKIFISWSGNRSKAIAEIISDWIKCVIQASQPWISTRDIDRGAIWFSEINDKLKDTSIGIVCLTQDNKNKPWILFEAGALAKGLTTNRVCTFLIDLEPSDLRDPLAQFNHTTPDRNSVWELVRTINSCLSEKMLDERILSQVFETYWPQFDISFKEAINSHPPTEETPPRTEQDLLTEILNNTRGLSRRVNEMESLLEKSAREKHLFNSDKKVMHKISQYIAQYIAQGLNEDEIVSRLIDYDLPEQFILDLTKKLKNSMGSLSKLTISSLASSGGILGGS
jgi:hypothetical protein